MNFKIFSQLEKENSKKTLHILYYVTSIYLILYLITSFTIIRLQIFPTINRVTYYDKPVSWTLTSFQGYDIFIVLLLFLIPLFVLYRRKYSLVGFLFLLVSSSFFFYLADTDYFLPLFFSSPIFIFLPMILRKFTDYSDSFGTENHFQFDVFFSKMLIVACVIEIIVLFRWFIHPVFVDVQREHWSWKITNLEESLFYAFQLTVPPLFILVTFSFLIKPFIPQSIENLERSSQENKILNTRFFRFHFFQNSRIYIFLLIIALSSSILAIYPYQVSNQSILSTDIPLYLEWLDPLSKQDLSNQFYLAFVELQQGSKPLSLLTIYYLHSFLAIETEYFLKILPAITGPFLVLSSFFFIRTIFKDYKLAILSSTVTAFSHYLVIGFYAGFYANMFALVTMMFSTAFLLRSMEKNKFNFEMILFGLFFTLTLFFHSYTWSFLAAVLMLFLIWSFLVCRKKSNSKVILILIMITTSIIIFDFARSSFLDAPDSFTKDLEFATSLGYDQFVNRWQNLTTAFFVFLGGYLGTCLIFLLVFAWVITSNYNKNFNRLAFCFLFTPILPILFGDFGVQARLIYIIPFHLLATIFVFKLLNSKRLNILSKPLAVLFVLVQFNYAFRAMANMDFVSPS